MDEKALVGEFGIILYFVSLVVAVTVGIAIGHPMGIAEVRTEAVKLDRAEWIPKANGETVFRWKEVDR
jgi:hypothetical protein